MPEDCLSVNCVTGTETVGGFLMVISQINALCEQQSTREDASCGCHPAYLITPARGTLP